MWMRGEKIGQNMKAPFRRDQNRLKMGEGCVQGWRQERKGSGLEGLASLLREGGVSKGVIVKHEEFIVEMNICTGPGRLRIHNPVILRRRNGVRGNNEG
jgi:hypothetical protein